MGFERQLVFPTFAPSQFMSSKDDDLFYGGIDALNRGMAETCAPDDRLVAVGMVSLREPERAHRALDHALDLGCGAILIPSAADGDPSARHTTSVAPNVDTVAGDAAPAADEASTVAADGEASAAKVVAAGKIPAPPRPMPPVPRPMPPVPRPSTTLARPMATPPSVMETRPG